MRGPSNRGNRRAGCKLNRAPGPSSNISFQSDVSSKESVRQTGTAIAVQPRNHHMRVRRLPIAATAAALALSTACSGAGSEPAQDEQRPARSSLPRALTTSERDVLGASNAFSFGLWKTINAAQRDSNVFVSP